MTEVYLGLGANVGDAAGQIAKAIELLQEQVTLVNQAPLYVTRPFGFEEQGNFLNTAVLVTTGMTALELRTFVKGIEDRLGRTRTVRNGPREIDIDILLFGPTVFQDELLTLPHAGLISRDFVLQPVVDLSPELCDPRSGRRLASLLSGLSPEERYILGKLPTITLKLDSTDAIRTLQTQDALIINNVLSLRDLEHYASIAQGLTYQQQAKEFGQRKVRQDVSSAPVVPGRALDILAEALQIAVAALLGPECFDAPLRFNHRNIQCYEHGSHGIDPHKDHHHNYNLVVLFGLDGSGDFTVYDQLGGPERLRLTIQPNALMIMKAPGFCGEQKCPWHGVTNIVGGEDGWRYILGLRQNDGGEA